MTPTILLPSLPPSLPPSRHSQLEVREVGKITPERGFSSFKFLPGSRDSIILALKSVEEAATGRQVRTVKGGKEGEMQGGIEGGTERLCLVSPHTH